jgi:hypothetical protein
MHIEKNSRWYDVYPDFSEFLERLKDIPKKDRDKIILGMKDIILDFDSELFDRHVLEYPVNLKRRWYDRDPYSWLVVNALKYAEKELIQNTTIYLKKEFKYLKNKNN